MAFLLFSLLFIPAQADPPGPRDFHPTELASEVCRTRTRQAQQDILIQARRQCSACDPLISRSDGESNFRRAFALVRGQRPSPLHPTDRSRRASQHPGWRAVQLETRELISRSVNEACPIGVARFPQNNPFVSFLPTVHTAFDARSRPQIYQAIEMELDQFRPEYIIVEDQMGAGCESQMSSYLTRPSQISSEVQYATRAALRRGIRVLSGEARIRPPRRVDQQGMEILRLIYSVANRQDEGGQSEAQAYSRARSTVESGRFPTLTRQIFSRWPLSRFVRWYQSKNGRRFSLSNTYQDITPSVYLEPPAQPRWTNREEDRAGVRRDKQVVRVTRQSLATGGRTLVIYGRSHFTRQLPAYEGVFGRSVQTPVARCYRRPAAAPAGDSPPTTTDAVPAN